MGDSVIAGSDQQSAEKTTEQKASSATAATERAAAERALAERLAEQDRLAERAEAGRSDTVIFDLVQPGLPDQSTLGQPPTVAGDPNETGPSTDAAGTDRNAAISPIDALFADSRFEQYEAATSASSTPRRWPGASVDDSTRMLPAAGSDEQPRTELLRAQPNGSLGDSDRRGSFDPLGLAPSGQQAYDQPVMTPQPEPVTREKISPFWAMAAVMAALALGALFFLGTKLPDLLGTAPVASLGASATPTPTPTPVPTGQAAPGERAWDRLNGGECVTSFASPFAEKFTVVDCAGAHAAQMVLRATFPSAAGAPDAGGSRTGSSPSAAPNTYPGEAALRSQINLLCTAPGVIDLALAGVYDDIEVQAGYAASAKEWNDGQHDYFCFVTRSEGQLLEGSVAGMPAS